MRFWTHYDQDPIGSGIHTKGHSLHRTFADPDWSVSAHVWVSFIDVGLQNRALRGSGSIV